MKILLITQSVNAVVVSLVNSKFEIVGLAENAPRTAKPSEKESFTIRLKNKLKNVLGRQVVSLKQYCANKKLPYLFFGTKDHDALKSWVINQNPDLIVVYGMSMLLKKDVFDIPKYGTINLHPAYLPDFRGPNAFFWHYYSFEKNPGVTVHFIDEGEDTGDIILQERISIEYGIRKSVLHSKLIDELGVKLLMDAIKFIDSNSVVRQPQPKESQTPRARNFDAKEYATLIDWKNWTTEQIWHLLRSTNNVKLFFADKSIFTENGIKFCGEIIHKNTNQVPGTLYNENGKHFVATADALIELY